MTETSSELFSDSEGTIKVEANVNNAFSNSSSQVIGYGRGRRNFVSERVTRSTPLISPCISRGPIQKLERTTATP